MIDEFRKSINSILYQRVSSPLWGSLLIGWIAWNWEIIYLTIFVNEEKLSPNKLVYIKENLLNDSFSLIWGPMITAGVLLFVMPIISYGVYWFHLIFRKWKENKKKEIEGGILLSKKESIELRLAIEKYDEKLDSLTKDKNKTIDKLKEENELLGESVKEYKKGNQELLRSNEKFRETNEKLSKQTDFSTIWEGEWVYELTNTDKRIEKNTFNIQQRDRLYFSQEKSFLIYLIKDRFPRSFELVLKPYDNDDFTNYRIVHLKRTDNVEEFKGFEVEIDRKGTFEARNREVRIYKAARLDVT